MIEEMKGDKLKIFLEII